jgi:hypothetical protein
MALSGTAEYVEAREHWQKEIKEENPINHALPVGFRNPSIPQY